jgi:transketolase
MRMTDATDVTERRLAPAPAQRSEWLATRKLVAAADDDTRDRIMRAWATRIRRSVVTMIDRAQLGHIGGDLSVTDILTVAYLVALRVDPAEPLAPGRDRFILSKGHCAASLYSALAYAGYFDPRELATFTRPLSPLSGHPDRNKVPGVETNTGPLGHGLPVGVGAALGARLRGDGGRVLVVTGDGELQEGSNWEALLTAAHYRLGNMTLVVDRNGLQQGARTEQTSRLEPLGDKLAAFGWAVTEVDGHDYRQLSAALGEPGGAERPRAVIARTVKGKGVSFIEDRVEWHHKVPAPDQVRLALEELA